MTETPVVDNFSAVTGSIVSRACTIDCCVDGRKGRRIPVETLQLIDNIDAPDRIPVGYVWVNGMPINKARKRGEPLA